MDDSGTACCTHTVAHFAVYSFEKDYKHHQLSLRYETNSREGLRTSYQLWAPHCFLHTLAITFGALWLISYWMKYKFLILPWGHILMKYQLLIMMDINLITWICLNSGLGFLLVRRLVLPQGKSNQISSRLLWWISEAVNHQLIHHL